MSDLNLTLHIWRQKDGSFHKETVLPVRFVPMTGEAQKNGKKR